jgi:hypothetical protein
VQCAFRKAIPSLTRQEFYSSAVASQWPCSTRQWFALPAGSHRPEPRATQTEVPEGLPELRELHAIEIGCPPPTSSVSRFRAAGDQEMPYANKAQTNATELYVASCPALGRKEAKSGLPGNATKPNADLQRYREPQRMVVPNLSLKTYFHCLFFTTARPVAASNAGRGSKLQKHGANYIPVPTLRNLTLV